MRKGTSENKENGKAEDSPLTHRLRAITQAGEHASASHSSGCRNFIIAS